MSEQAARAAIGRARAYLLRVAEPPAIALRAFVARNGPVAAAELVRAGEVPDSVAKETSARREIDSVDRDFDQAERVGARLVVPEDEEWPSWRLLGLELAARRAVRYSGDPIALWVRGRSLEELGARSVAMVGSRAASSYGEHVAADFAAGLAAERIGIVSGAAYGIDGAAHRGALAAGGRTLAVLACGIDVLYPAGQAKLFERILECGSLVSEYPPGCTPARFRFLARNRLIAALGDGTVVVEAGRRSGARNTAATAAALGRPVLAVPGPVTSAMSLGCHALLREAGATIAGGVPDILAAVGPLDAALEDPERSTSSEPIDALEPDTKRVLELLALREPRLPERLAADAGVELERVRAILPALEIAGLARRHDEGWLRTVALPAGGVRRHTVSGT